MKNGRPRVAEKMEAFFELAHGTSVEEVADKYERLPETVQGWYELGLSALRQAFLGR